MDKAKAMQVIVMASIVFMFAMFQMSTIYKKHGLIYLRDYYSDTLYITPQTSTANFIDRNLSRTIAGRLQYSDLAYGGFFVLFVFSFPIAISAMFFLVKKE